MGADGGVTTTIEYPFAALIHFTFVSACAVSAILRPTGDIGWAARVRGPPAATEMVCMGARRGRRDKARLPAVCLCDATSTEREYMRRRMLQCRQLDLRVIMVTNNASPSTTAPRVYDQRLQTSRLRCCNSTATPSVLSALPLQADSVGTRGRMSPVRDARHTSHRSQTGHQAADVMSHKSK
jgi:hypothetical protein